MNDRYRGIIAALSAVTAFLLVPLAEAQPDQCWEHTRCIGESFSVPTPLGDLLVPTAADGVRCGEGQGELVSACLPRLLGAPLPRATHFTYLDIDSDEPVVMGPFTNFIPASGRYGVAYEGSIADLIAGGPALESTLFIGWDIETSGPGKIDMLGISPEHEIPFRLQTITPTVTGEIRSWIRDFDGNLYLHGGYDLTPLLKQAAGGGGDLFPEVFIEGYSIADAVFNRFSPLADEIAGAGDLLVTLDLLPFLAPYQARIGGAVFYALNRDSQRLLAFTGQMESAEFMKILPFADAKVAPQGEVAVQGLINLSQPSISYFEAVGDFSLPGKVGAIENALFRADRHGAYLEGDLSLLGFHGLQAIARLRHEGVHVTALFDKKLPGLTAPAVGCGYRLVRDVATCGIASVRRITSAAQCGGYESFKCGVKVITSIWHCGVALFSGKPKRCSVDIHCKRPKSCGIATPNECLDLARPIPCSTDVRLKGQLEFQVAPGTVTARVGGSVCIDGECARIAHGGEIENGKVCIDPSVFRRKPLDILGVRARQCLQVAPGGLRSHSESTTATRAAVSHFGIERNEEFELTPLLLVNGWVTGKELRTRVVKEQGGSNSVSGKAEFAPATVVRTGHGCIVTGMIGYGEYEPGKPLAILPPWCRPSGKILFNANQYDQVTRLTVTPEGRIEYTTGNSEFPWISLEGLTIVTQANSSITLNTSRWKPYGKGYLPPSVVRIGDQCILSGLARKKGGGTPFSDKSSRHIGTLPRYCTPNSRLIFNTNHHDHTLRVDLHPSGKIEAVAGEGTSNWVSLSGISYAPDLGQVHSPAPEWQHYTEKGGQWRKANYRPLSVLKDGNLCMVSGLVASRETITTAADGNDHTLNSKVPEEGITIATLPPYCRPRYRHAFNMNNHTLASRVDLFPNGDLRWMGGGLLHDWVSLSGISFLVADDKADPHIFSLHTPWNYYGVGYATPTLTRHGSTCMLSGIARRVRTMPHPVEMVIDGGSDDRTIGYIRDPECLPFTRKSFFVNQHQFGARVDIFEDGEVRWIGGVHFPLAHKNLCGKCSTGQGFISFSSSHWLLTAREALQQHGQAYTGDVPWLAAGYSFGNGPGSLLGNGIERWEGLNDDYAPLVDWISLTGISFTNEGEQRLGRTVEAGEEIPLTKPFTRHTRDGHSRPRYLSRHGVCRLTGRIALKQSSQLSSAWGKVGTLGSHCRPPKKAVFHTNLHEVPARVTVRPDGSLHWVTGLPVPGSFLRSYTHPSTLATVPIYARPDESYDWWFNKHFLYVYELFEGRYTPEPTPIWLDLDGIVFPTHTGAPIPLADGVRNYGAGYGEAQVTDRDGLCLLSGLLKVSTAHNTKRLLGTLPMHCRPEEIIVAQGSQHMDVSRINILPNGEIWALASNPYVNWVSLGGILFPKRKEG